MRRYSVDVRFSWRAWSVAWSRTDELPRRMVGRAWRQKSSGGFRVGRRDVHHRFSRLGWLWSARDAGARAKSGDPRRAFLSFRSTPADLYRPLVYNVAWKPRPPRAASRHFAETFLQNVDLPAKHIDRRDDRVIAWEVFFSASRREMCYRSFSSVDS